MHAELPPLAALLSAYAPPEQRPWHRLCWLLDQRLAAVVRRGGEPTIAAIRLAWWEAVLVEGDRSKGGGEPLVEAWRSIAPESAEPLVAQLIDGWRTLLGAEALSSQDLGDFGAKRGGGLFALLGGEAGQAAPDALARAGAVWALWDLAGHSGDPALAQAAIAQAAIAQGTRDAKLPRGRALKPLRLLYALARADVLAGRVPGGFEGRHYRALLRRSLFS